MKNKMLLRFCFGLLFAGAFRLAWGFTETIGGYTWKYQINGNTAEIYNPNGAISPEPTGAVTRA